MTRMSAEFEYGLTRKIDFAYYVNWAIPGSPLMAPQYAGSKFRLRGQFFEKDQLPINLGWYAEIEWWGKRFEDNLVEGEIMLIAQKDIGRWTFIVNAQTWITACRSRYAQVVFAGLSRRGSVLDQQKPDASASGLWDARPTTGSAPDERSAALYRTFRARDAAGRDSREFRGGVRPHAQFR